MGALTQGGILASLFLLEKIFPGWRPPRPKGWILRLLGTVCFSIVLSLLLSPWWLLRSFEPVFNLSERLRFGYALPACYLLITFVRYWWHRWRHSSTILWRLLHQLHHSPRQIEMLTGMYKHPLDYLFHIWIDFAVLRILIGADLDVCAACIALLRIGDAFAHSNLRTPRWLGFLLPTPEVHRVHHQHGKHWNNFGDVVFWDMLFRTYENPRVPPDRFGYDDGVEDARFSAMLVFVDVNGAHSPKR